MNQVSSKRKVLLDKANGVTSLLVLLTVGAMIPGGIRLFRFLMDAQDGVIGSENLLGWGDLSLPGGFTFQEPYGTLALLIMAVGIPLLLFIALLVKKSRFSRGVTPGSGAYWFAILVGAAVILTALGFTGMVLNGSPAGTGNIVSSPLNLAFTAVGILMVISAIYAISLLSQARSLHEPELVNGTADETGEPHYRQTLPADTEPIAIDHEDDETASVQTVALTDVPYDRPRIEQTVTIPLRHTASGEVEEEVHDNSLQHGITDPEEEFRTDVAMSAPGPLPDGVAVEERRHAAEAATRDLFVQEEVMADPVISEAGPVAAGMVASGPAHPEETAPVSAELEGSAVRPVSYYEGTAPAVQEDPEGVAVRETGFFEGRPSQVTGPAEAEAKEQFLQKTRLQEEGVSDLEGSVNRSGHVEKLGKPVVKRRFLKFPDDETKVIVLYREFTGDEVIREWAEIRPRSEFAQKRTRD